MGKRILSMILILFGLISICCISGFAQNPGTESKPDKGASSGTPAAPSVATINQTSSKADHTLPMTGVGARVSSLGIGVEGTTAVTRRSNVRLGFNFLNYDRVFNKDQISYAGQLSFRSLEAHYDFYLRGGFHVSPGLLTFFGTPIDADAMTTGGQSFSLGDVSYFSDPTNPVKGTATMKFSNKVSPSVLLGFGNLLPRNGRHFGMSFDMGVAFPGSPMVSLNLAGSACTNSVVGRNNICQNVATDPTIRSNVRIEENKLNDSLKGFKYYPLLSLGFTYKL